MGEETFVGTDACRSVAIRVARADLDNSPRHLVV